MKIRSIVWLIIAIAGSGAGATGSRMLASAPDIHTISDFPFFDLLLAVPCLLLLAWGAVSVLGKHSVLLLYFIATLGVYGTFYGLFELIFHNFNGRPALSSLALFLFGLSMLSSCYLSARLFGKRLGEA